MVVGNDIGFALKVANIFAANGITQEILSRTQGMACEALMQLSFCFVNVFQKEDFQATARLKLTCNYTQWSTGINNTINIVIMITLINVIIVSLFYHYHFPDRYEN